MPMPKITITLRKDGRQVARFRDNQGLVRTSVKPVDWVKADQIKELADYGIALQISQARHGIGSDGQPMPPLKGSSRAVFAGRANGRAQFTRKTYADYKAARGLQPSRDLYGFGKNGHMLDDIRINYLDDRQASIAITRQSSRDKARGNENRAPWWGWSPQSIVALQKAAGEIFGASVANGLVSLGLAGSAAVVGLGRRILRRAA